MRRYILAPEAALDPVEIWRYLKKKANVEIAERVERAIREKIAPEGRQLTQKRRPFASVLLDRVAVFKDTLGRHSRDRWNNAQR